MVTLYYELVFSLSFILTIIYVFAWRRHYDVNITIIFLLIPLVNLSYFFLWKASDVESAIMATKSVYMGGCFLMFFITMCVINLCDIKKGKWIRRIGFLISTVIYVGVLTLEKNHLLYKSYHMQEINGKMTLVKEYGPLHSIFYGMVIAYTIVEIVALAYSLKKKKQVPRRLIYMLIIPVIISVMGYLSRSVLNLTIETVPVGYVIAQIMYLLIVRKISRYKVADMVVESMVRTGGVGFISFDLDGNYIGSNETAKEIIPDLKAITIDQSLKGILSFDKNVNNWLDHFRENDTNVKTLFVVQDENDEEKTRFYNISTNYLYDGKRKCGYQIFLEDDTQNQKYIRLLNNYNDELTDEVEEKTRHIVEMHDNLILGMATMVESRDNSTGGHIKRTSEGVRILIDEIKKAGDLPLTDSFCKNIIKAAPMHDIGKIAVDDAILRKPGKFTDEEYEKMKKHAEEGARIIREILKETDDEEFKIIAENVAHYHHERWDGSGYPEKLVGEQIPIEARIMAIADVYDALVSKRVYKEKMSFEEADKIIMDGMGKHFDASLKPYYVSARPRLEEYYKGV